MPNNIDAPLFVVVQITNGDKDYTFAQLQQGVKKQGYGNLLDDYNDVKDYGYSFQLSTFVNKWFATLLFEKKKCYVF